jgi:hypothetical protein
MRSLWKTHPPLRKLRVAALGAVQREDRARFRLVPRVFATFLLAWLVTQTAGIDLLATDTCDSPCEESEDEGQCSPTCEDCLCCPHTRLVILLPALEMPPADARAVEFGSVAEPVVLAAVAEIQHVPKSPAVS